MSVRRDKQARQQPAWILDYIDENRKRRRIRVHGSKSYANVQYGMVLKEVEKRKLGLSEGEKYMQLKDLVSRYLKISEINGKSPLTVIRIRKCD